MKTDKRMRCILSAYHMKTNQSCLSSASSVPQHFSFLTFQYFSKAAEITPVLFAEDMLVFASLECVTNNLVFRV